MIFFEQKSYRSSVTFNQGNVTRKTIAEGYLEKNSASFLSADLMANNTANDLKSSSDLKEWANCYLPK